jgi:hypothetical protein
VYVGTAQGHLLHSTGDGVWQDERLAPNVSLYGIWGRSASAVYLGTSDGVYRGVP